MQNRKALFKAALALAEMSAATWARQQGVHPMHLSLVLNEKRESKRLTDLIDQFIKDTPQLKRVRAA
jgi:hypothetical protein